MIYFKTFNKNLNFKKDEVIGSASITSPRITIYSNPIFTINPTLNDDIYVVKPISKVSKHNGDSVTCRMIAVGEKITVEDMLYLDIGIRYKLNIVRRIFDKDIQKRYDLFNHLYENDNDGKDLYYFAKEFPNAINKKMMYDIIKQKDSVGTYLSKMTILYDGYQSTVSYRVAIENDNYDAIVEMAINGIHAGIVGLQSLLVRNCNDASTLKRFYEYCKNIKGLDNSLLINKIQYLSYIYEEKTV